MALGYTFDSNTDSLSLVIEEYTTWFIQNIQHILYPKHAGKTPPLDAPHSFDGWIKEINEQGDEAKAFENIKILHQELLSQSHELLSKSAQEGQAPAYTCFEKLTTLFEEFIAHLRRIEHDLILGDVGWDTLSGLRSMPSLRRDFDLEMERLSRQGRPFCVAFLRINHLNDIKQSQSLEDAHMLVKDVANVIKKSVRSFDDAYHGKDDNFVLCFKQADMVGGVRAMERLRTQLERSEVSYTLEGKKEPLMFSSCITEVTAGDSFDDLMMYLKEHTNNLGQDNVVTLEYTELSPLQRYVKETMTD